MCIYWGVNLLPRLLRETHATATLQDYLKIFINIRRQSKLHAIGINKRRRGPQAVLVRRAKPIHSAVIQTLKGKH